MSIRITDIRFSGGVRDHEHIIDVQWITLEDGDTGTSSVATDVAWIENKNGERTSTGANRVSVGVVRSQGVSPTFGPTRIAS